MSESTSLLVDNINTMTTVLSPFAIVAAILLASLFGQRFLRNYENSQKLAREEIRLQRAQLDLSRASNTDYSKTNITIAPDPSAHGGYDFIQVPDEFKSIFLEAMAGFRDYAKLRGYSVDLSVDTSLSGKVGVKVTIVDVGVTISTATVRRDVDDYLQKFKDGDDFDDMPAPDSPAEALLLKAAIKMRFNHLKTQMEMHKFKADLLEKAVDDLKGTGLSAVGYPAPQTQSISLTVQNDGGKNMRDSYEANNSQNIAQGTGASAYTNDSNIQIGSNHTERNQRIEALKEFVREIDGSNLTPAIKGEVTRYIENARDEMETAETPNPDEVGKWLGRAEKTLSTLGTGAEVLEKMYDLLAKFGLS